MTLTVRAVSKRYGSVQALDSVSALFAHGEIHAVLGENGAGKSTLMSILGGFTVPDSGSVELDGKPWPVGNPIAVKAAGLEMVHQHFMLVPQLTVAENIALAKLSGLARLLNIGDLTERAIGLAKELGWSVDPDQATSELSVGQQQRVEILKAISSDPKVLVLDEPTAVLSEEEVSDLFEVLRQIKARGTTILLIAHKLSEVQAIADRVTVLRRGRLIASAKMNEVDLDTLASWMVGEAVKPLARQSAELGDIVLEVNKIDVVGDKQSLGINQVSFSVRKGEVLGIGGVDGNGQVELAEALVGIRPVSHGSIGLESTRTVGYIPQDRQLDGLALGLSIKENLLLGGLDRPGLWRNGFLRTRALQAWTANLIQRFAIKVGSARDAVKGLSGGNQQKVVVSRTLDQNPDVLVVVNPTRGLDIKASNFVLEQIEMAKNSGAAIVLISTDRDEMDRLADRKLYLGRGKLYTSLEASLT